MNRTSKFACIASALLAIVALAASCEKTNPDEGNPDDGLPQETKLEKPVLSVTGETATSFTIQWEAIENADSYTCTINDGAEQKTTGTSISFSSLAAGKYTVKVKATSENEAYADSDWASCEVTLAAQEDGTFSLDVYLSDKYADYGYGRHNSVWFTATGTDITAASYTCYTYQEGFSDEDMIADFEAGGEYIFPVESEELALLLTAGFENGFIGLPAETTFEISFYVTFSNGNKKLYRETVTTEAAPEAGDDVAQWIGTWDITSDKSFSWVPSSEQGYVDAALLDTPKSGTLTIESDPTDANSVIITGLCGMKQLVDYGYDKVAGTVKDGNLILMNRTVIGETSDGTMGWYAYSLIKEDGSDKTYYSYVNGDYPAFAFSLSGNTATSVAGSGTLSFGDGSTGTFNVLTYDIYLLYPSGGLGIYHQTGDSSYAGTITLTRTSSDEASTQFKAFDPLKASPRSSIHAYSAMKVSFPAMQHMD